MGRTYGDAEYQGTQTFIGDLLSPGSAGSNNFKAGAGASVTADSAIAVGYNASASLLNSIFKTVPKWYI